MYETSNATWTEATSSSAKYLAIVADAVHVDTDNAANRIMGLLPNLYFHS